MLFMKELQKRQINSIDDIKEKPQAQQAPPFTNVNPDPPPQLIKSRQLGSEGFEGLVPRASELIKLGVSFFLAFGPFLVAVTAAFFLIYNVFGDAFVHGGRPGSGPSPYVDPDALLNEPTVDPMVPLVSLE
jgi:hypothetical protein